MSIEIADFIGGLFYEAKAKTPREIRVATPEETERATMAVEKALETHQIMSYGRFWSFVTQKPVKQFNPSESMFAISLANAVKPGASALLVNRNGKYGNKAPAEQHAAFLKENGYETIPQQG